MDEKKATAPERAPETDTSGPGDKSEIMKYLRQRKLYNGIKTFLMKHDATISDAINVGGQLYWAYTAKTKEHKGETRIRDIEEYPDNHELDNILRELSEENG